MLLLGLSSVFVLLSIPSAIAQPAGPGQCTCTHDADTELSYYRELTDTTTRTIRTNGIPNHAYHHNRQRENPHPVCAHPYELSLPLAPETNNGDEEFSDTPMGVIGILKTGGFLFNHKSSTDGVDDVANHPDNEQPGLDGCHGHANSQCQYHYHEVSRLSECTDDGKWDACEHIGWLRDGFPIYSHCPHPTEDRFLKSCYHLMNDLDNGGGDDTSDYVFEDKPTCDLDLANGYNFTDKGIRDSNNNEVTGYAYLVSDSYPYVMAAYRGSKLYPLQSTEQWTFTLSPSTLSPKTASPTETSFSHSPSSAPSDFPSQLRSEEPTATPNNPTTSAPVRQPVLRPSGMKPVFEAPSSKPARKLPGSLPVGMLLGLLASCGGAGAFLARGR